MSPRKCEQVYLPSQKMKKVSKQGNKTHSKDTQFEYRWFILKKRDKKKSSLLFMGIKINKTKKED